MQNTHVLLSAYATYSVYVCNPLKFVVGLRLGSRLVSGFALELGFCFHFCSLSYLWWTNEYSSKAETTS